MGCFLSGEGWGRLGFAVPTSRLSGEIPMATSWQDTPREIWWSASFGAPDPVPCPNCAVGEWELCHNGQHTERGIKQVDGFTSELANQI
jgi:hypothetical protein